MTSSVPDKAKVNAKRSVETLLPRLIEEYRSLLSSGFIFQQNSAPAHTAKLSQDWITTNYSEFIGKDEWPPNSPDVSPLDYRVWESCLNAIFHPKSQNTDWLKKVLQLLRNQLPQDSINKIVMSFTKRRRVYVKAGVDISNVLWDKLFKVVNIEHYIFFSVVLAYETEYCKSSNFWGIENISAKFSSTVEKSFSCKS